MANFLPRCSVPISSRMNGKFWTVEMMIFLPPSMNCAQVARMFGVTDCCSPPARSSLIVSLICLIEDASVGDHDDRVEEICFVPC